MVIELTVIRVAASCDEAVVQGKFVSSFVPLQDKRPEMRSRLDI